MNKTNVWGYFISILDGKLFKASFWLTSVGVVVGILGYLFQIIMGRILTVEEYGIFVSIVAFVALMAAPLSSLTMIIARKISYYHTNNDFGSIRHLFYSVNAYTLLVIIFFLFIAMFYIEDVQIYLSILNRNHIYLLGCLILLSFIFPINNGFLQGLQDFKWLNIGAVLNIIIKIIAGSTLVWIGFGVSGALFSIIIASIVVCIVTYIVLKDVLIKGKNRPFQNRSINFKSALPVLIANISLAMMMQMDVILVKHYFSAHDAGIYASASILGKAVMYLPGGVVLALFPMTSEKYSNGENANTILMQSLIITFIMCSVGALFYYFMSDRIITTFYGEGYRAASELVKFFGIAMLPLALVIVLENFLIAQEKILFSYLFMLVAPLQIIAINFYHDSLLEIIFILAVGGYVLLTIGFVWLLKIFKPNWTI